MELAAPCAIRNCISAESSLSEYDCRERLAVARLMTEFGFLIVHLVATGLAGTCDAILPSCLSVENQVPRG